MKATMKAKLLLLAMMGFSFNAIAYEDNPSALFDATKNTSQSMNIIWKVSDDPAKSCDIESKKVGNGGFAYRVKACAFWTEKTCTIITGKNTSMHSVGHELRHCFQGDWHPQ
jgi:hypothetical protein